MCSTDSFGFPFEMEGQVVMIRLSVLGTVCSVSKSRDSRSSERKHGLRNVKLSAKAKATYCLVRLLIAISWGTLKWSGWPIIETPGVNNLQPTNFSISHILSFF